MTDVAAVVAAAAGNRGIGFQGKLVSFYLFFCACHVFVFPIALVLNKVNHCGGICIYNAASFHRH